MSVQFPGTIPPNDWVGPTGIAYHGNFYVGTLGQFPVTPGTESIYKVTPSGQLQVAASGLTAVLGVAFDAQGRLYALETDTVPGFPGPAAAGSGMVVRVNGDDTLTTIASGLVFPTAMTFGPDGNLYVSNFGFGVPVPGLGQIVRIDLDLPSPAAAAPGLSQSIAGPFTAAVDSGPDWPSPVHIRTHGVLTGNFQAIYDFTMLTPQPTSDPTALVPTGRSVITTPNGTQLFGMDSGVGHVGADGTTTFTTTVTHVGGTRKYRRATGQIVATGTLDFVTGRIVGTYTGEIDRLADVPDGGG
jgi:hypothetical protein